MSWSFISSKTSLASSCSCWAFGSFVGSSLDFSITFRSLLQVTKLPGTKYRESTTGKWIITPIKRMMHDVLCCQEVVGDSGSSA